MILFEMYLKLQKMITWNLVPFIWNTIVGQNSENQNSESQNSEKIIAKTKIAKT